MKVVALLWSCVLPLCAGQRTLLPPAVLWPEKKETTTTTNRKRNTLFAAKLIRAAEHHVPY